MLVIHCSHLIAVSGRAASVIGHHSHIFLDKKDSPACSSSQGKSRNVFQNCVYKGENSVLCEHCSKLFSSLRKVY